MNSPTAARLLEGLFGMEAAVAGPFAQYGARAEQRPPAGLVRSRSVVGNWGCTSKARQEDRTMRLAEKTVELNFCKGLPVALGRDLIWFGLTQKQEARAGFDACTRAGSTLMLFQIKASNHVLAGGSRRFVADHAQMQALRDRVRTDRRVVYVLPTIGTTTEICHGLCFSHCSRYLDVAHLPAVIPQPLARRRVPPTVRKSGRHYIDLHPGLRAATIHSEPFEARVLGVDELVGSLGAAESKVPTSTYVRQSSDDAILSEFQVFWSGLAAVDRRGLLGAYAV